jgi:hypothetical protein
VGNNFGVNIHRATGADFDLIAKAGLRIVRLDLTWERVEGTKGIYDWSGYDRTLAELRARGLRALLILAYSNSVYATPVTVRHHDRDVTRVAAPLSAEARAAFVGWGQSAAQHFARDNPMFEIWNEPDQDLFWPPHSDSHQYAELANATCQAIRSVDPSAAIIAPGAAWAPSRKRAAPAFLAAALASDVAACVDGVSVHYYLDISELHETGHNWELLKQLIAQSLPSGARQPVPICSESGLSTGGGSMFHRPPDDMAQAFYAVRMMLLNFASGVPISIWYDWKDDGDDPSDRENRFGLVRRDLTPKPAYRAVANAISTLAGASLACASDLADGATALVFSRDGEVTMAGWRESGGAPANPSIPAGARIGGATDMFGHPLTGDSSDSAAEPPGVVYFQIRGVDSATLCAHFRGGAPK